MLLNESNYPLEKDMFQEYKDYNPGGIAEVDEPINIPVGGANIYLLGVPETDPINLEIWTEISSGGTQLIRVATIPEVIADTYYLNLNTADLVFHSSNYGQTVYATYTSLGTFWRSDHPNKITEAIENIEEDLLELQVYKTGNAFEIGVRRGRVTIGTLSVPVSGVLIIVPNDSITQIYVDDDGSVQSIEAAEMPSELLFPLAKVTTASGVISIEDLRARFNITTASSSIEGGGVGTAISEINIAPKYPNSIEYDDGGANIGILTYGFTGFDVVNPAINLHNYVDWESAEAVLQHKDIIIRLRTPRNFRGWAADPIQIWAKAQSTNINFNDFEIAIFDSNGNEVPLQAKGALTTGWTKYSLDFI